MITSLAPRVLVAALVAALLTISIGHAPEAEASPLAAAPRDASSDPVQSAHNGPPRAGGRPPAIAQVSQPATAEEFLALLRGAGFDEIPVLE
ncbi:MAG: hypothetical protein O6913_08830, partial [Chloroflexi bacterium]|nr:hypothetical protein [Chloroflexota bacterium]